MNFAKRSIAPSATPDCSKPVAARRNVHIEGVLQNGTSTIKQICLDDLDRQTLEAFHAKLLGRFGATGLQALKFYSREIDGYVDVDEFQQLEDGMRLRVELSWPAPPAASTLIPTPATPILPRNLFRIGALHTSLGRDWSVRARVLHKEDLRRHQTGCEVFRVEILDVVGDRIDVVFWDQCATQQFPRVQVGRVYIFSAGTVSRNKIHHGLQINMRVGCKVLEDVDDGTIPLKAPPVVSIDTGPFLSDDLPNPNLKTTVMARPSPNSGTLHIPICSVRSTPTDFQSLAPGEQPCLKRQHSGAMEEELPAKSPVVGCRLCERPVGAGEELCLECSAMVDPLLVQATQPRQPDSFYARGAASRAEAQHQFDKGVLQRQVRLAARSLLKEGADLTLPTLRHELGKRGKMPPKFDPKGRHPREAYLTEQQTDEVIEQEIQAVLDRKAKAAVA
eukprot:GGOE01019208.1.p1 GENE.GGOE01019208.1~~GGOE01019208.1.p1  ORF type:complete len:448 (+),score=94.46 GGOE01019208.1:93-1436(+)